MRKDQEPNSISIDTGPESVQMESIIRKARRKWGALSLVAGGALATSLLAGIACGKQVNVDPTLLEPHNVPWVNADLEDKNGDGFYNRTDAYIQGESNWRFDLDMEADENGVFWINEEDLALIACRVGTKPVPPKFDPNIDGQITPKDVEIIRQNQGMVEEDPNPNARLDELDGGIILDGNQQDFKKRKHFNVQDTIIGTDRECDSGSFD